MGKRARKEEGRGREGRKGRGRKGLLSNCAGSSGTFEIEGIKNQNSGARGAFFRNIFRILSIISGEANNGKEPVESFVDRYE